jgi:hypothetical protein
MALEARESKLPVSFQPIQSDDWEGSSNGCDADLYPKRQPLFVLQIENQGGETWKLR